MMCNFWSEVESDDKEHTKEWCKNVNKSCTCSGDGEFCDYPEQKMPDYEPDEGR